MASYPLPIFIDGEKQPTPNRGRGRSGGRGRGRWPRSRPPSRSRGNNDEENANGESSKSATEHINRRGNNRGRGRSNNERLKGGRPNRFSERELNSSEACAESDEAGGMLGDEPSRPQREVRPMGVQKLISLASSESDPDTVLMDISHSKSGFYKLITSTCFQKHAFYIMKVVAIAIKSNNVNNLREFLEKILDLSFLTEMNNCFNGVILRDPQYNALWCNNNKLDVFCKLCAELLKVLVSSLPSSLVQCFGIYNTMKQACTTHDIPGDFEDVNEVFKRVQQEKTTSAEKTSQSRQRFDSKSKLSDQPPDDFRTISIFPTLKDIHTEETPFLRANKAKGKYDSLNTYLDVQFRLLREDYLRPLRDGIFEFRKCIAEGSKLQRSRNIRVYDNVQIIRPVCSSNGINHIIQFDNTKFKKMNWASSRRLLYGSLVCLSCDNFQTVHYATIANRNDRKLAEGYVEIHFETLASEALNTQRNETFVMAETTAYFEAFRYILEGLQEINEPLPFASYIIKCETQVRHPQYLQEVESYESLHYDFECILKSKTIKKMFPVLSTRQWPSTEELGLDVTQYTALQTAVTREFAIIQGPPGTGKTFVGLKIVQILLANETFWHRNSFRKRSPILVVCYTNHALDQFLEGILKLCNDTEVVRIGGRSKNEALEPFSLANVKKKKRDSKLRTYSLMQRERDCRANVRQNEQAIMYISKQLKNTIINILPLNSIDRVMSESHQRSFTTNPNQNIFDWLNCSHLKQVWHFNADYKQLIVKEWKSFILNELQEMSDTERMALPNVWGLSLAKRGGLYKSWIAECMENITIHHIKSPSYEFCQRNILSLEQLSRCLENSLSLFQLSEVSQLHVSLPGVNIVEYWVCMSEQETSIREMKKIIDSYEELTNSNNEIENDKDLEEERALDDDDDFLFDNVEKEEKGKRKCTKSDTEWVTARKQKQVAKEIQMQIRKAKPITDTDVASIDDVWRLDQGTRWSLYVFYLNKYRKMLKERVTTLELQFNTDVETLQEVKDQETVEVLNDCAIVGMTTTGAAKYRKMLQKVEPQIIVVEEAAEVLESHIIATLNKNCKHLILIGDHKQLRPTTTVYELSKKYALDISLFERMVRNEVPCITLEEQHRMRPNISALLRRESLYPNLRDHESVLDYDNVKGVDSNLQFISHTEPELDSKESTSYSNPHEATYIAALARYFINQGYAKEQITVLTPYMGQVLLLRKEMPKELFSGVRITAVDNFQGEENDIILLSLVRSSYASSERKNPIGFVGIENRICVSLSRAKKGLFVIGNFSLIEACSSMWGDIIFDMRELNLVKSGLLLRCSNHPEEETLAESAADFKKVPEGGCRRPCGTTLACGHICPKHCHVLDLDHKEIVCTRPCTKIVCSYGHTCTKQCYKKCGDCFAIVEKTIPLCSHKVKMHCCRDPDSWICQKHCEEILPCGHKCKRKCHDCITSGKHEEQCKEDVSKTMKCGHTVKAKCHMQVSSIDCRETCVVKLDCGHLCSGTCGSCFGGRIHKPCNGTCGKILPCGHKCTYPCTEICPPCSKTCGWFCSHGRKCKKKCFEPCDKCMDNCLFKCKHSYCEYECSDICSVAYCNKQCTERLKCKHICQGLCGERCVCIECSRKYLRNPIAQQLNEESRFVQLPDCKCIFEVSLLDRHMAQPQASRQDLSRRCPHCKKLIQSVIRRYSTILKETRRAISERSRTLLGSEEMRNSKVKDLHTKIATLGKAGMSKTYLQKLGNSLTSKGDSSLRAFEKKVDALSEVLKIPQNYQSELGNLRVLTSDELQQAIVDDRKYISLQFLKEITRETKRMQLCQYVLDLKKTYWQNQLKYVVLEPLVNEIITVLTTCVEYNDTIIDSAIQAAESCWQNDAATEQSNVESKVEQLRQERDMNESQQQDSHQQDEALTKNKQITELPEQNQIQASSTKTSESNETEILQAEDLGDDINSSDFTGTIEVQMTSSFREESAVNYVPKTNEKRKEINTVATGEFKEKTTGDTSEENPLSKIISTEAAQTKRRVRDISTSRVDLQQEMNYQ